MSDRNAILAWKKNDPLEITITDINNLGCGVGHTSDGRVVFVRGAVTGEHIRATVIKVTKSYLVARMQSILSPSPYRIPASGQDCGVPDRCGGCVYRHITYEHECLLKQQYVKNAFIKAGLPDVTVEPVHTTGQTCHYRNKAQYPVGSQNGQVYAGFYAAKTHTILPVAQCSLQPPIFSDIVKAICSFCSRYAIPVYEEETGTGLLRHIYLRSGQKTGEILLCLVINGDSFPMADRFCRQMHESFPDIVGILLNHNRQKTNVVLGDSFTTLWGKPYLEDILCGKRFCIAPDAFYQVNHDGAELLYQIAAQKASLTGKETLLDLYCGIGTIGLSMADRAAGLIGVEVVPAAIRNAQDNARRNGIENAVFICGDASDTENLLTDADTEYGYLHADIAIIDPPRKGSTPELIRYLCQGRQIPRIVYVSCDPDTLARDCVLFRAYGYEIGTVTPVDMFPRTGHIENVVCLTRSASADTPIS